MLEIQYDAAKAALDTLSQRQSGILKYLEHLSIVFEQERHKLPNAGASRQANELIQEQRGRAAMLIFIRNRDGHLSAVPARRHANEARDGYQSLLVFFSNRQHDADVITEIELGQASERVGCKSCNRAKEPPMDALSGQAFERDSQALLVVGPDRAYANRSSIAQRPAGAEAASV